MYLDSSLDIKSSIHPWANFNKFLQFFMSSSHVVFLNQLMISFVVTKKKPKQKNKQKQTKQN